MPSSDGPSVSPACMVCGRTPTASTSQCAPRRLTYDLQASPLSTRSGQCLGATSIPPLFDSARTRLGRPGYRTRLPAVRRSCPASHRLCRQPGCRARRTVPLRVARQDEGARQLAAAGAPQPTARPGLLRLETCRRYRGKMFERRCRHRLHPDWHAVPQVNWAANDPHDWRADCPHAAGHRISSGEGARAHRIPRACHPRHATY